MAIEIVPPSTAPSSQNAVTMPVLEESTNVWPGTGGPSLTAGVIQLNGGSATVATTAVKATSQIFLGYQNADLGTAGILGALNIFDGIQFDIASSNIADANFVNWLVSNNP